MNTSERPAHKSVKTFLVIFESFVPSCWLVSDLQFLLRYLDFVQLHWSWIINAATICVLFCLCVCASKCFCFVFSHFLIMKRKSRLNFGCITLRLGYCRRHCHHDGPQSMTTLLFIHKVTFRRWLTFWGGFSKGTCRPSTHTSALPDVMHPLPASCSLMEAKCLPPPSPLSLISFRRPFQMPLRYNTTPWASAPSLISTASTRFNAFFAGEYGIT